MLKAHQSILNHLLAMQKMIRAVIVSSRGRKKLYAVDRESEADTIYAIDALVEPAIEEFCRDWSRKLPLVLIAEGINGGSKVFPEGTDAADAAIRLIVDPIDGTRGIMFDKRSAWSLAGVAPNRGAHTRLRDIEVAVMTELPTSKMGSADVLWAIQGKGAHGRRVDLASLEQLPIEIRPSSHTTLSHGFASVVSFFPGTKVLAGDLLEEVVRGLTGRIDLNQAAVFDDQYICTGGQFYEMMMGHDRFIADVRPRFYQILNQPLGLCCHPYDCCTMLIAKEAGVVVTDGWDQPLDGPMDCTTGLSWIAYANPRLRQNVQPLIERFFHERGADEV